ncbi:CFAH-like protein, partial [Mya arenaria]
MLLLLITIGVAFQENFASHISIPKHGSYVSSYLKLSPFPPSIPFGNAIINGTLFTAGSTVPYQCDEGHMRFGNNMIACQSDGTWTNPPECRRLCAMIPSFPNAVPQSPNPPFLSGSTVIYKCLPNFTRAPGTDSFITCMSGGWWMGTPTCLPNCKGNIIICEIINMFFIFANNFTILNLEPRAYSPIPPMIPNGMPVKMDNEFSVGSVVQFMCDANYAITGPDTVTCQENGAWTKLPECRKLCPEDQLPMPADATPLYGSPPYVVGSIVVYACNDVTQAVAPNSFAMCMQDGSWMSDISCTPGCSEIPTIEFGTINSIPSELAYGCSVTYTCYVGYALVGPHVTSCLLGGTWSPRPECKKVCPVELPVFEHAFPVSSNPKPPYFESEIIRYECEECYTLAPGCKNSIRCEDGCWKGEIQCVKECVNALPSIPNATPLEGYSPPYLASDTVVYRCNDGYVMNSCGPNYVTCQADGEWSDEPVCIPD